MQPFRFSGQNISTVETANKLPENCKKDFPLQFSLAACFNQPFMCFCLKFLQLQNNGTLLETRLLLKLVSDNLATASGCYLKGLACIRLAFSSAMIFSASSEPGDS